MAGAREAAVKAPPVAVDAHGLDLRAFWYVAAESTALVPGRALARTVLGEPLVMFRDAAGRPAALEDRCRHRAAPLSRGRVEAGRMRCGYHGWLYANTGEVVEAPSSGCDGASPGCAARAFSTSERDGYVYVRPASASAEGIAPFPIPHLGKPGWGHVRLVHRFRAGVTECAENFVNVPHTAWVHPVLFRSRRHEQLRVVVTRRGGTVTADYHGEGGNLGVATRFLNHRASLISHRDTFHMPNVTCVEYAFGPRRRLVITSQSVPVTPDDTLVYTDLTYDYGAWTRLMRGPVRWLARRIIAQDQAVLAAQTEVVRRVGEDFMHMPADLIYVWIAAIRHDLERGRDPRRLPPETREIILCV
ncbi:MAG TPA: aromatic ring-hydroxylating dioxygenase subunit alpha [Candidatus Acidoferrum sp.]|nr:aromatic ring-hydroxylating dioxygenase subunit alpha [Candidatus Acidoferrum sp.]